MIRLNGWVMRRIPNVLLTTGLIALTSCAIQMQAANPELRATCPGGMPAIQDSRAAITMAYKIAFKEPANTFNGPIGSEEQWLNAADVTHDEDNGNWTVW